MPTTKTSICNLSLGHCCIVPNLDDVDEDDSNEAICCRTYYDQIRDILLEQIGPWPFCERQIDLQEIDMTGSGYEDLWDFMYIYPNTAKRINFIVDPSQRQAQKASDKIPFKVVDYPGVGRAILTDQESAIANINFFQEEPAFYPVSFTQPLSLGIATHITGPLKVKADLAAAIQTRFNQWLAAAITQMQAERQDDPEPDSESVQVRI